MYTSLVGYDLAHSNSTADMMLKTIDKAFSIGKEMLASCRITWQFVGERIQNSEGGLENTSCSQPRGMKLLSITNILSELEVYAHSEKIENFISFSENINWREQPPHALLKAIDIALALELSSMAMRLSQQGKTLFPNNMRIQNVAKVLCESNNQNTKTTTSSQQLHDSRKWLHDYADQYKGKWVAVQSGKLLVAADSLKEVKQAVGDLFRSRDTIITKIL